MRKHSLMELMPEVLTALRGTGANVSLAEDLEAAIKADRQRRGEPVARVNEDGFIVETGLGLAPGTYLFAAPQPAEPVAWESTTPAYRKYVTGSTYQRFSDKSKRWYKPYRCASCDGAQTAAPAQEPVNIDDEAQYLWDDAIRCDFKKFKSRLDALLARYGHPVAPEGWQLVPKEPTEEMLEGTDSYLINPDGELVDIVRVTKEQYRELLAAAPKFGEEE